MYYPRAKRYRLTTISPMIDQLDNCRPKTRPQPNLIQFIIIRISMSGCAYTNDPRLTITNTINIINILANNNILFTNDT